MKKILSVLLMMFLMMGCAKEENMEFVTYDDSGNISEITIKKNKTITLDYIDNGDEAPSVLLLVPGWKAEELALESVYSVTDVKQEEGAIIMTCMTGDYYSHEIEATYKIGLDGNELIAEKIS